MRSCNTYQDIKTPEDEEEELSINGIYEDLVDNALSEPNGRLSPYTKARLMKKAKEIYYKKDNQGE